MQIQVSQEQVNAASGLSLCPAPSSFYQTPMRFGESSRWGRRPRASPGLPVGPGERNKADEPGFYIYLCGLSALGCDKSCSGLRRKDLQDRHPSGQPQLCCCTGHEQKGFLAAFLTWCAQREAFHREPWRWLRGQHFQHLTSHLNLQQPGRIRLPAPRMSWSPSLHPAAAAWSLPRDFGSSDLGIID